MNELKSFNNMCFKINLTTSGKTLNLFKEKLFTANLTYYTKKITLNSLFKALERKKVDAKVAGGYNK